MFRIGAESCQSQSRVYVKSARSVVNTARSQNPIRVYVKSTSSQRRVVSSEPCREPVNFERSGQNPGGVYVNCLWRVTSESRQNPRRVEEVRAESMTNEQSLRQYSQSTLARSRGEPAWSMVNPAEPRSRSKSASSRAESMWKIQRKLKCGRMSGRGAKHADV